MRLFSSQVLNIVGGFDADIKYKAIKQKHVNNNKNTFKPNISKFSYNHFQYNFLNICLLMIYQGILRII